MICFDNIYNIGDDHNYKLTDYSNMDEFGKVIVDNENVGAILPI